MADGHSFPAGIATSGIQAAASLSALIESTDDLIWSVDLNFRILTLNSALRRHVERNFGTLAAIGKLPEDLLPPERARLWPPLFLRALNEGPFRQEIPFPDGRIVEMSFNPTILDGRPTGISMFGRDITERKTADRALQSAERRYKGIFDGALEGMFQNRADGKPLAINRALAAILGYDSRDDFMNCVKDVSVDVWKYAEDRKRLLIHLAETGAVRGFETQFKKKDGALIWVSLSVLQERSSADSEIYLNGFFEDITARKQAEFEFRESLESLREAQAIGGLGSYVLNVATASWTSSQIMDEIFGIGEDFDRGVTGWYSLIHPDEHDAMSAYFLDEVLGRRQPFDKQYRIVRQTDQQVRWVHGWGRLEFDLHGQPAKMRGVIKDITQQKLVELQLRESEERYRASFEQAAVGIVHCSFQGVILRCNTRFADLLDYPHDQVPGMTIDQLTHPPEMPESRRALEDLWRAGAGAAVLEKQYVRKDGSITLARTTVCLQRDGEGRPLHFLALVEDISARKAAEQRLIVSQAALEQSEQRYRTAFQTSADAININRIDDGTYIDCNQAFLNATGFTRQEVIGKTSHDLGFWVNAGDRERMVAAVTLTSVCRNLEAEFRTKSGRTLWGTLSASLIDIDGLPCALSITRDISEAKAIQQRLAAASVALTVSEERYRKVFETSLDPILINRADNERFIDVNQAFLDVMGFTRDEVIGRTSLELNLWTDPRDLDTLNQILAKSLECRNLEVQFHKKNGVTVWALISASVIEIDGAQCVLAIARDISEAKAAENEIRNLAFYDPLTGLSNRRLLLERLNHSLSAGTRSGSLRALLFVDLDHFKTLNDTLGHQTGDLLLQQAARRLQNCVRDSDTLGRLGGDEFVLMLEDLSAVPEEAATQARAVGQKILDTIRQPYLLDGRECRSSASIGISIFGDRRESTKQILQQADIAMYQAKAAGRNTLRFFAPALQVAVNARAAMEEDLCGAIRSRQFVLYYQPVISRNRLIGAEALIRWNHPWRNILGPVDFIPLAEETGLILNIGQWVLDTACGQIASWAGRRETARLTLAINISARQFHQPDFVHEVLTALDRSGANPANLGLELTESMLVENVEEVIAKMKELKSHGLQFSLDDFGTGYSSLAYLKRLPLNQLKIDRSFIRDIVTDESSAAIAQTIISLSRAMKLPVIAEGVETEEQRQFLTRMGCHAFQGYLFSRPLPLDRFEAQWLNSEDAAISKAG